MNTETYILPEHWASYLINNDKSGLSGEELEQIQQWIKEENPGSCVSCEDEPYFKWSNDATSMGGNVLEYSFTK